MRDHDEARQPESGATEPAEDDVGALRAQLDEARSQADEQRGKAETYLDLAQRAQADFQNFKRRTEQERERTVKDANAALLRGLLPALDDLDLALDQVPAELREHTWARGMSLIGQKLQRSLEQQGLSRIGAEGEEFDPQIHEAIAYEEHPEYAEGQVAQVYHPGYTLHERVLRPAQVTVARAGAGSTASGTARLTRERQDGEPEQTHATTDTF